MKTDLNPYQTSLESTGPTSKASPLVFVVGTCLAVLAVDLIHFLQRGFPVHVSYDNATWLDDCIVFLNLFGFFIWGFFGDVLVYGGGENLAFRLADLPEYLFFYGGGVLPWLFVAWMVGMIRARMCNTR